MKIQKLFKNIKTVVIKGSKDAEITGLSANSALVAPGNLFIAKKGGQFNGADFIPDAIAAGASAILTDLYNPFFPSVTQVVHPDPASIEALIAQEFYGRLSKALYLVGVTGTNGKTTTSYLIRHLMEAKKKQFGLIGTIEQIVGQHVFPSSQTTPDLIQNYKLFNEMVASDCFGCVMEVSSHALAQGRVEGIEFDVAVFTNLTQDHLDYHKTIEQYASSKAKLFSALKKGKKNFPKVAVVNVDSPFCQNMIADCPAKLIGYGISTPCALRASKIAFSSSGVEFDVDYFSQYEHISSCLIGRYNVYNLLAAAGVGLAIGFSLKEIAACFKSFGTVPGRLERVPNEKGLNIFVDYAHTEDALYNVLKTLREFKKGRLITVFGCGGDRDENKRPKMGAVVETFSDLAIVTSDNPRSEDPEEIIRHILAGLKKPGEALVVVDREQAIHRAIQTAQPDDIVLIAGKGHETTQVFSHQTVAFDDRVIAGQACSLASPPKARNQPSKEPF